MLIESYTVQSIMDNNIFILLLSTNQNVKDVIDKYSLQITQSELNAIQLLIKNNPQLCSDISTQLNEIFVDGKLNVYDIPNIVIIISKLINVGFSNIISLFDKTENVDINILNVVKYIVCLLLESNILPFHIVEKQIIEKMLNHSFNLLDTVLISKSEVQKKARIIVETVEDDCYDCCCSSFNINDYYYFYTI